MTTDRETIEKIIAGDTLQFRVVIEQYKRLVYNIAFRMVPNAADREDLCQDVFVKVYQNLSSFQFESKLSTWIARIAFNTCVNHLKKKRVPLFHDFMPEKVSVEDFGDLAKSPYEEMEHTDIAGKIEIEIEKLPAVFRTILTLFHLEQMSYEEIGKTMAMPAGTVKSYLFRARKLLKERLTRHYVQEELWERGI